HRGRPREGVRGVPRPVLDDLVSNPDRVVGRVALLRAVRVTVGWLEELLTYVLGREVVDRLQARLVQHHRLAAVGDPLAADLDPDPLRRRLEIQRLARRRWLEVEAARRLAAERPSPGHQTYGSRVPVPVRAPARYAR